jgi:hypothetical protein
MLASIPSVSLGKSRNLSQNYPNLKSLLNIYKNKDHIDRKNILVDKFDKSKKEHKLSKRVYTIFTSYDENKPFDD